MYYIEGENKDPYYNLALEEYMMANYTKGTYLLLWINEDSIVMGKYQNAYEELNLKAIEEDGIPVVRRISGGGTVFHDKGNLNYSFITDADREKGGYEEFLHPIIKSLNRLGIHAQKRNVCDIVIGDKKISGSAKCSRKGRVLQHGTLLFDSDLKKLRYMDIIRNKKKLK